MATVISQSQYADLTAYYNKEGRSAAYQLLRTQYGIKHPGNVFTRIKKSGQFPYDQETDKFSLDPDHLSGDDLFLGIDTLCSAADRPASTQPVDDFVETRSAAIESLVHDLLSDRLLALSHYITMDTVNRTVYFDQSALQADGYRIITH